jgi:hypothetical protein
LEAELLSTALISGVSCTLRNCDFPTHSQVPLKGYAFPRKSLGAPPRWRQAGTRVLLNIVEPHFKLLKMLKAGTASTGAEMVPGTSVVRQK